MGYDGVLLDYDGVVVRVLESDQRDPAFREELADRFRDERLDFDGELADSLAHSVSAEQLRAMSERTGLDSETIWQFRDDALDTVLRQQALDGNKRPYEDVSALREVAVPIGVASNNQQRVVEFITDAFGLNDQFETIHARDPHPDSLEEKKPAPNFLEAAMAEMGVTNPLYVGDKETDIIAGDRLDLDTVLIRRDHNVDWQIEREPTYEVETLEAVVEILESTT